MSNQIKLKNEKYLYLCDYNQIINASIKDLYLQQAGEERKIKIEDVDVTEELLRQKVKTIPQLIFEITESCNLRCKYCIYNDNYVNQRQLTTHHMDFETARKGIDYMYHLIKDREEKTFSLSFYGGEPLLNFKTIEAIVAYSKERFQGWRLHFNMTTNLTLLTEPILDFLIENDCSILVSLDGDKVNHDAKRVFSNGTGTFDQIMKNLEKIHAHNITYFQKRVSFSGVHSMDLSLLNLYHFFSDHPLLQNQKARFSSVNTYQTTYYDTYPFDREKTREEYLTVLSTILNKLAENHQLSGLETFMLTNLKNIGDALETRGFSLLFGTCLFDSRIYLSADGHFHMCEKMNNRFSFGNVETGFDYKRMVEMAVEYMGLMKKHCLNCNIRFLCSRCFVNFCGDGHFQLNEDYCRTSIDGTKNELERFITCKEQNLF